MLEAFDYAAAKVKEAYEKDGNLLSEHATLDDGNEGKFAATQFLLAARIARGGRAAADPGDARAARAARRARGTGRRSCG